MYVWKKFWNYTKFTNNFFKKIVSRLYKIVKSRVAHLWHYSQVYWPPTLWLIYLLSNLIVTLVLWPY